MRGELRDDIRVTAENVIADAQSITNIEERKLDASLSGDELQQLSDEAARLADDLARKAAVEQRLVDVANAQDNGDDASESELPSDSKRR